MSYHTGQCSLISDESCLRRSCSKGAGCAGQPHLAAARAESIGSHSRSQRWPPPASCVNNTQPTVIQSPNASILMQCYLWAGHAKSIKLCLRWLKAAGLWHYISRVVWHSDPGWSLRACRFHEEIHKQSPSCPWVSLITTGSRAQRCVHYNHIYH